MRRWVGAVVAGALVLLGCSDDGRSLRSGRPVERTVAHGELPQSSWDRHTWLAAVDGRLLAVSTSDDRREPPLVVSNDGGGTWEAVELPGKPELVDKPWLGQSLYTDETVAVFAGHDLASASPDFPIGLAGIHVWTSRDGGRWRLHRLDTDTAVTDPPRVIAVGGLLLVLTGQVDGLVVHTSADHGSTWRRAPVTGYRPPLAGGEVAVVPSTEGLVLLVGGRWNTSRDERYLLRSVDEGASWSSELCADACPYPEDRVELDIEIGTRYDDGGPEVRHVMALDRGWLVTATTGDDDYVQGHLLRSDDGRHWEELVVGERCTVGGSIIGRPVQVADRWYVAKTCEAFSVAARSQVFVSDAAAERFEPVVGTERDDVRYGHPLVDGQLLLIPEVEDDGRLVAITRLRAP